MALKRRIVMISILIVAVIIAVIIVGSRNTFTSSTASHVENTEVPILLFHHIVQNESGTNESVMSLGHFEQIISALHNDGYHAVNFDMLIAYTENMGQLPDKPILITFDDGYESAILLGKPVLEKYEMQATVFAIGVSVGKSTYKDTGMPITPHFSWAQAAEARDVISVQSHTYDMHKVSHLDLQDFRSGVLRKDCESEADYIKAFREDMERFKNDLQTNLGTSLTAVSYPYGLYTDTSEALLKEAGIKVTVTTVPGVNRITKGVPESLNSMKRIAVTEEIQPEQLIKLLSAKTE